MDGADEGADEGLQFTKSETYPFLFTMRVWAADKWEIASNLAVYRFNRINWAEASNRGGGLLFISVLMVILGALLYSGVSGASWGLSVFNVYSILFNVPGSSVTEETAFIPTLVLNFIFIVGLLVFAVLIGMVSEEIGARLLSVRSGTGPLTLKGHILLLNWNKQMMSVITQLSIAQNYTAHPFHGKAIVVLADMDHDQMLSSMAELYRNKALRNKDSEIYVRSGRPFQIQDLTLVSAEDASIVILLYPESSSSETNAESLRAATIACLSTLDNFAHQSLIVQVPSEASTDVNHVNVVQTLFRSNGSMDCSGGMRIVRLSEQSVIDRLVAQSSLQPGLCTIYERVLRNGKDAEFVWVEAGDDLRGKYSKVRIRFPDAVTLGYISSFDDELHLNPGDADIVTPGDKIILMAQVPTDNSVEPVSPEEGRQAFAEAQSLAEGRALGIEQSSSRSRKVLVLGWPPEEAGELVAGFSEFSPPGTQVTFIVSKLHPDLNKYIKRTLSREPQNRPYNRSSLSRSRPHKAHSLVDFTSSVATPENSGPLSRPGSLTRPRTLEQKAAKLKGSNSESASLLDEMVEEDAMPLTESCKLYVLGEGGASDSDSNTGVGVGAQSTFAPAADFQSRRETEPGIAFDDGDRPREVLRESSSMSRSSFGRRNDNPLFGRESNTDLSRPSEGTAACLQTMRFSVGQVSFTFQVHEDPICEDAMRLGDVMNADSVILGLPTKSPYPYSDSQVLSSLLLIQDIVVESNHMVHVVAKVDNSNTKKVAKRFFDNLTRRCVTFELLISDQITSAILTQVAWQPSYSSLVQELLVSSEGMEMYIVEPSRLGFKIGEQTTFAEVTECARAQTYTVIGISKKSSSSSTALILAPPASQKIHIEEGDHFILLAEEWD